MLQPKIILVDVDGVMCNGKYYDVNGNAIYKRFNDLDFTAIKSFWAMDISVVFITSDPFNEGMAKQRHIPCHISRKQNGRIDKVHSAIEVLKSHNLDMSHAAYIGDDLFDVPLLNAVRWAFCPANAGLALRRSPHIQTLNTRSGDGVIASMLDWFCDQGLLPRPRLDDIVAIDAEEYK